MYFLRQHEGMPPYAESGSTVKFCMNKLWCKFEKNPSVTCGASSPTGAPVYRRQQHQTAKFHLISHSVTASPRGEADCSLRPGGEGGATRRMRVSLTVSSHQIQRIGGMRACSLLILTLAQKKHTVQLNRVLFA